MAKGFASTTDTAEKKVTFSEIGTDLYAFTAEGDPNTAVIAGEDGCLVFDAQATPAMANKVIERVRKVTDKPIKYVVLSHYHAVRVLGASAYRAQAIVTGQGETNRIIGFAASLEDVLIKVSGALKLAGDVRLEPYKARAKDFVKAYDYHDQMSGTPTRDEQGTRDRPYDLIVDFDEAKIDGLLATLGFKPWSSQRPDLGVFVEMEQGARQFIVTSDAKQSDLQRDSLSAASARRGMAIVLPEAAVLAKANVSAEELMSMPSAKLAGITGGRGGEVALVGHLTWSDDDLGWITAWQMEFHLCRLCQLSAADSSQRLCRHPGRGRPQCTGIERHVAGVYPNFRDCPSDSGYSDELCKPGRQYGLRLDSTRFHGQDGNAWVCRLFDFAVPGTDGRSQAGWPRFGWNFSLRRRQPHVQPAEYHRREFQLRHL